MASAHTLTDSFSDNSRDTSKWGGAYSSGATHAETSGTVVVTLLGSTGGSNYAGYQSTTTYDLTGSQILIKLVTAPNTATGAGVYLKAAIDGSNWVEMIEEGGSLVARKYVAGVFTYLQTTTYNSTTHKWWKIRENNGTTYWEYSSDGVDWAVLHSVSNPITVTALYLEFGAGTFQSETSPGTAVFDNFNLVPVDKDGIQAYATTFTGRTSTGIAEITDVPFLPKMGIFICTGRTADGSGASSYISLGVAIGPTIGQRVASVVSLDNQDTSDTERTMDATQCIEIINTSGTVLFKGALNSWEANGCSINQATVDANARKIFALFLGGNFLGTTAQGKFNPSAGTGAKTATGWGIRPKAFFLFSVNTTAFPQANFNLGIGMSSGVGQEGSSALSDQDGQGTSNNRKQQQNNSFLTLLSSTANTNQGTGTLTSYDSDGISYSLSVATTNDLAYLAWSGAMTKVVIMSFGTSTGDLNITNVGFRPVAMIVMSTNEAAGSGITDGGRLSFGIASGPSNQYCMWMGTADNSAFSNVSENLDSTKVVKFATENGASPTVVAAAALKYFTDDGAVLDRTTADGTSREMIIMFIGGPKPPRGNVNYQNPGLAI